MAELDLVLALKINEFAGRYEWLDVLGRFFARDAVVIMVVLLVLLWFMDWGLPRKKNRYAVIMSLEAIVLGWGVIRTAMREIWPRMRPFVVDSDINLIVQQSPLEPGFPSGHTVLAFAIALPVLIYNRKAGIWLLFLAIFVGLARVFTGVHYPGDIVAGFAVALVVTLFINYFRHMFVAPIVRLFEKKKLLK